MRRRLVVALGVIAFSGVTTVAAPATPGTSCWTDQPRVWRIRRQGGAPRSLDASIEYRSLGTRSTIVVATGEVHRGRWRTSGTGLSREVGNRSWTTAAYPVAVYGGDAAPVATPDRPRTVPQACEGRDAPATLQIPKAKPTTYDWFIAAIAAEVSIKVAGSGWTVTELKPDSGASLHIYRNEDGRRSRRCRRDASPSRRGALQGRLRCGRTVWLRRMGVASL